jgi:hypothetical protein
VVGRLRRRRRWLTRPHRSGPPRRHLRPPRRGGLGRRRLPRGAPAHLCHLVGGGDDPRRRRRTEFRERRRRCGAGGGRPLRRDGARARLAARRTSSPRS